jgi:hypothetical protein
MFAEEQCDRRQREALDENWNGRLNDEDQAEYRALAGAALSAALPHLRSLQVETQVEYGRALGRKEALDEAAAAIKDHPGPDPSPASPMWWEGYGEAQRDMWLIVGRLSARDIGKGDQ